MSANTQGAAQLPRPGDMIAGKYVLDRLLGQGGMGAVFAAKHVKLSKAVAIKIMLADTSNPEAAQRFINEGRAAANIQNEHVVRVDDVDEEMGYAYMVLELLDGEDLSQLLERELTHRLLPHVAVGYVLQALKGVMQAHAIGIVHRNLKPSNLFLARRKDGSVVVKVLDFGISKAQGSSALAASPNALTSTKAMLGSPLYMSPEQLRSSKSVDHRADIWAIGVILYELMTGSLPFFGDNLGELFAAILETDPTPVRQRADGVHPGLEEIVLRCLARRPEHRFQSAAELAVALAPFENAQMGVGFAGTSATAPGAVPNTQASPQQPNHPGYFTPSNMTRPSVPQLGAVTSGSGPRPIGGTVALGAVTPQGMVQTNNGGWQSTESVTLPKSKTPVIVGGVAAAVLVVVGLLGILLFVKSRHPAVDPTVASSGVVASAEPPPPPPPPPAVPTPAVTTPEEPPAEPPAATSATAARPAPATKPTTHHGTGPVPTARVNPPVKPTETKPADPTPKPKPPPNNNPSGGLQNAR